MTDFAVPPLVGTEREMLIAFNNQQREAMLWRLEGLSEAQLREVDPVTGFCLLGLLKHLVRVERIWFQGRVLGEPVAGEANDDTAWVPTGDEAFAVLSQQYRQAFGRSNAIAESLPLDRTVAVTSATFGPVSLQWVLYHMIEETARHLGHADVIRQSIDGATGVNPAYEQTRAAVGSHPEGPRHEQRS